MSDKVELDFEAMLASSLTELVDPIFRKTWISMDEDEQKAAIVKFTKLHKFVGALRQSFDDALTTEHAKGNLSNVEHIRKPRETKETKEVSMADFLKNLK